MLYEVITIPAEQGEIDYPLYEEEDRLASYNFV